ncbi:putative cytochrome b5 [Ilyonectria robusta]
MSEQYTAAEVGKHKSAADGFWLIVESDVYDVTILFTLHHPCNRPSHSTEARPHHA